MRIRNDVAQSRDVSNSTTASGSVSSRFLSVARALAAVATVATAHCGAAVAGEGTLDSDARVSDASPSADGAPSEVIRDVCNGESGVLQPSATLLDERAADGTCSFSMNGRAANEFDVYRHECSQHGLECVGSLLGVRCVAVACTDRPGETRWYWRGSGGPLAPPELGA